MWFAAFWWHIMERDKSVILAPKSHVWCTWRYFCDYLFSAKGRGLPPNWPPEHPSATTHKCSFSCPNTYPKTYWLKWSYAESTLMKRWNDCCEHLHRVSQQDIMYQKIAKVFLFAAFLLAGVIYYLCVADLSLIIIFYGPKIKGMSSPIL